MSSLERFGKILILAGLTALATGLISLLVQHHRSWWPWIIVVVVGAVSVLAFLMTTEQRGGLPFVYGI